MSTVAVVVYSKDEAMIFLIDGLQWYHVANFVDDSINVNWIKSINGKNLNRINFIVDFESKISSNTDNFEKYFAEVDNVDAYLSEVTYLFELYGDDYSDNFIINYQKNETSFNNYDWDD